jgi:hypothetical protein
MSKNYNYVWNNFSTFNTETFYIFTRKTHLMKKNRRVAGDPLGGRKAKYCPSFVNFLEAIINDSEKKIKLLKKLIWNWEGSWIHKEPQKMYYWKLKGTFLPFLLAALGLLSIVLLLRLLLIANRVTTTSSLKFIKYVLITCNCKFVLIGN